MNIGACFNCVQIGNMVKDCPKRHENTGSAQVEEGLRKIGACFNCVQTSFKQ